MRVVEHQPPIRREIPGTEPTIFLAGPIQGASNWQQEAIGIFEEIKGPVSAIHVANPRRDGPKEADFTDEKYIEQVTWEENHLLRAAKFGAIVFWFAKQDPNQPYEAGRAYAQTSRVEFGEVLGWKRHSPDRIHVLLGIEPGYSGSERYFRFKAHQHRLQIHDNLPSLCMAAVRRLPRNG